MGNFSWRTCDTDKAILHVYNKVWAKPTPAYVLIASKPAIYEDMPASKTAINQGFWPDDDKNAWMDDDDEE